MQKAGFFYTRQLRSIYSFVEFSEQTLFALLKNFGFDQFVETVEEKTFTTMRLGSEMELENYQTALEEVLTWLLSAEDALQAQGDISNDVEVVKEQFHTHEVYVYTNLSVGIYQFVTNNKVKSTKQRYF